jgi:hypothetical protein
MWPPVRHHLGTPASRNAAAPNRLRPDGNDHELAWDRPFDQWPRYSPENADDLDKPLDVDDLLAAAR